MSKATCKSCPFWHSEYEMEQGECRKALPRHAKQARWPPTYRDEWCGEHPDRQPDWSEIAGKSAWARYREARKKTKPDPLEGTAPE